MSTILKALRRLEEEKNTRAARGLRDEVVALAPRPTAPDPPPPARRRSALGWLAAGAAATALVWALWPAAERPETLPPPVSAPALPSVSPPVTSAPAVSAPPVAAPVVLPPPVPVRMAEPVAESPAPQAAEALPIQPQLAPKRVAPPAAAVAPEQAAERAAERRRPSAQALEDDDVALPGEDADVALSRPRRGPDVIVARTTWHPDSGRRVALVDPNGGGARRELREGDYVEDYRVVRIEPSGVVFERAGVERLLRIGQTR